MIITHPEAVDISNIGLGPWSHSKLKLLRNCPFQFYLKYIAKAKPDVKADSQLAEDGKAVHRILELIMLGKSITDAYRITRSEIGFDLISEDRWATSIATCEFNIAEFRRRMDEFEMKHPIKRILTEFRTAITKDFEPTGFFSDDVWFRGVIDLALQLQNNDFVIIDHKKGGGGFGIRNYKEQLDTYKVMIHHGITPVRGATAGINFVEAGEVTLGDYTKVADIETSLRNQLVFYVDCAVESVVETGFFKHKSCNACKYCEYATQCKAGELKAVEKETKRFFEIKKV